MNSLSLEKTLKNKQDLDNKSNLIAIKPQELAFKGLQICLRCGKRPALEGDIFCSPCIRDRADIDELIKLRNKDKPKPIKEEEKDIDEED